MAAVMSSNVALSSSPLSTLDLGSTTSLLNGNASSNGNDRDGRPTSAKEYYDAGVVAKVAGKELPPVPGAKDDSRRDRSRGSRSNTARSESIASNGSEKVGRRLSRMGRGGKGFGPSLPIRVSPSPSPSTSPRPPMMSLASMRNQMKLDDDDVTPGESSDAFEDAPEDTGDAPTPASEIDEATANGHMEKKVEPVGLGIDTNGTPEKAVQDSEQTNAKMSARLSRWVTDEEAMYDGEATPTHSRQVTAEKVPDDVKAPVAPVQNGEKEPQPDQAPELDQERSDAPSIQIQPSHSRQATTEIAPRSLADELGSERSASPSIATESQPPSRAPSHSRQTTAETIPATINANPTNTEAEAGPESETENTISKAEVETEPERQGRSHSRQVTAETAPALASEPSQPRISLSGIRAGLQSHSRNTTAESAPSVESPPAEQDRQPFPSLAPTPIDRVRERSTSPSQLDTPPSRGQSPNKFVRALSGGFPLLSSQSTGEGGMLATAGGQHTSTSPQPQVGNLMRNASTRVGALLGRMGTIRNPTRSPPAPKQENRFTTERRNTAQSVASVQSNGRNSVTSMGDSTEAGEDAPRPSLQDQFQTLRKQEEYNFPGADDSVDYEDVEKTPIARSTGESGFQDLQSPTKGSPETRTRTSSISSRLKSPPVNPSLPPGTASGMTAGPAEEPRPVDWDLWQSVVYEGPSAVTRTSGEELNQAIASGIPAAIRGVVWQVLAESKNQELENVYRTLKARGSVEAEAPAARPSPPSRSVSQSEVNGNADKTDAESEVASSRASVHSDHSTPATSNMASPAPSVQGDDQDLRAKLLAEKQKREAAALSKLEKAIRRDMGTRTSYSKFTQAAGLQDGLFGVCKAYALFDEGVGYAQGINFIAMPLLFNMTEEEAFTLLVRLMSKYELRTMFTGDMAGLHLRLYQFERLLEDQDPALYCHLKRRNVGPQLYATQWFLTLFAYRFPLQLVLRVYDLVFTEGLTAILKFGLVVMQHNRDALLAMRDMGQLTNFLKEKLFDVYIDKSPSHSSILDSGFFGSVTGGADKELYRADEMVRDACDVNITEATLAQYKDEWEESQRLVQARDTELETLRNANTTLTTRVKALEEQTQQTDNEHVTIASDMVRIKVENDTLHDENEGLKVKIEELQKMVETQPEEVEAKLKEEMDRILQRNSEVQSENRVLKEEQEEMEGELVDVKMRHAQVSNYPGPRVDGMTDSVTFTDTI